MAVSAVANGAINGFAVVDETSEGSAAALNGVIHGSIVNPRGDSDLGKFFSGTKRLAKCLRRRRLHQFDPIAERIVNVDSMIPFKRFIRAHVMPGRSQPTDQSL